MTRFSANRGISKLTTPGHIYFIQAEAGGPVKIGWATSPETRMAHLQAHGPVRLVMLHSEPGNGREEAELHKRFASDRLHGEWFTPSTALLAEIQARRCRNSLKAYEPAIAAPIEIEPVVIPLRSRQAPKEKFGPTWPPPQEYWDYGNPGWDKLVKAAESLDWSQAPRSGLTSFEEGIFYASN